MKHLFHQKTSNKRAAFLSHIVVLVVFVLSLGVAAPASADHRPENAPKIANWNFNWSIDSEEELHELSEWDVLIIDVENAFYSRNKLEKLKELNPDIVLLAYISMTDIRPDAASLDKGTARQQIGQKLKENPDWKIHLSNGEPAEWWPTYHIYNITKSAPKVDGKRFKGYYIQFIREEVINDPIWDGIFYDNLWESITFVSDKIDLNGDGKADNRKKANRQWRGAMKDILKKTRKHAKTDRKGKNFIITGNGGTRYHKQINGVAFEHFPSTVYGQWTDSMKEYYFIINNGLPEQYVIINTNVNNTGNKEDYKKFRFGLMSTLLNDGYYSFDNGDGSHRERWYYDEYNAQLGEPISGAYNVLNPADPRTLQDGVWRRDFEYASVLVNSTNTPRRIDLRTGYEKINGEQDPKTNSGDVIGTITIPPQDGILLLNRLTQVFDAPFTNGAFSKVWDSQGKEVRNSFFAYDGSFQGGQQVYKNSKTGRTYVAGDTNISIYDRRNQLIGSFAPYGPTYNKGITFDIDTLNGGKKLYLVTANKSGTPHIRIFDANGKLIHPGCYPFGASFKGGANVALGDLNGDKRQEIIVGAGAGGSPSVRMLSNTCELISTGFSAFSSTLRSGVAVAAGDINGDGKDEIIAVPGPGGAPQVKIFNKNGKLMTPGFFAYSRSDRSGVFITTADIDGNGIDEILTNSFSIFNTAF